MKVFFIAVSFYILYLLKHRSQDRDLDTFKIEYVLIVSLIASILVNYNLSFSEVCSFSARLIFRLRGRFLYGLRV